MKAEGQIPRHLLFTSLLESPRICGWMLGAGALHVALAATRLGGWDCPFHVATGYPCPGCGLGRASVLLLRGEVRESIHLHAFAGPLLAGFVMLAAGWMPGRKGAQARSFVRWIEERTWVVPGLLSGIIIYWLVRFSLDATEFCTLVR